MEEIVLGYTLPKPIETQEECDAYAAMAAAVNSHNAQAVPGERYWVIAEGSECYEVVEGDRVLEAEEETASEPTLREQVAELRNALADADALAVDQEYRLTLLELGVSETE